MTRIVATSDLHGKLPAIPSCDLLLIVGDICPSGAASSQAKWLDTVCRKWLDEIDTQEIVVIAGNHDRIFEQERSLVPKDLPWHYLQDSSITLFGLKIYGTPWQLPFYGVFNLEEEKLKEKYEKIPPDIDILISHGPPFGYGDEVQTYGHAIEHVGSTSLKEKAFEIQPKLFLFGHIHNGFGLFKSLNMTLANVSLLDNAMQQVHHPVFFDI